MNEPAPRELRQLLVATGVALLVAGVVLVTAVLPAEYGVDPTGLGGAMGLTALAPKVAAEPPAPSLAPTVNLTEFEGAWPTSTRTAVALDGALADGESLLVPVEVADPNLVSLQFVVAWLDGDGAAGQPTAPDQFVVTLTPPDGPSSEVAAASSDSGNLVLDRPWRSAPSPVTVAAASADAAYFALRDLHPPDHSASGTWLLNITLTAGQATIAGVPLPGTDEGQSFQLTGSLTAFELDASVNATSTRINEFAFDLGPGQDMEFKVYLDEAGRMDYAWNGSAEVYFDFHGDPAGGDGSNFRRHGSGLAAADGASFTAPFAGNHGWYWQNNQGVPVRINLELRGNYVLLG